MIYVKKYGGSLIKNENDLSKISYKIANEYNISNKKEKTKFIIVISAFKNKTSKLKKVFQDLNLRNDISSEAAYLVTGELETAPLLAMLINNYGVKTKALNAYQIELLTNDDYLDASIVSINKEKIDSYLADYDIIIVAGYQGINKNGDFTTLGFNGSDFTALYLASLYHTTCEIYKDTALRVSNLINSPVIENISYDQILFLIRNGLDFLQEKLILFAKENHQNIILKDYNTNKSTTIGDLETISDYPLNISEKKFFQVKIYSPYLDSDTFINLIKKIFAIKNCYYNDEFLSFTQNKNEILLLENKSMLILNSFKNTTFVIDNITEYQIIYSNLEILNIPKKDTLNLSDLLELRRC